MKYSKKNRLIFIQKTKEHKSHFLIIFKHSNLCPFFFAYLHSEFWICQTCHRIYVGKKQGCIQVLKKKQWLLFDGGELVSQSQI